MRIGRLIPFFFFLLIILPAYGQQERILSYKTEIEVHQDRSITVTELIKVMVQGDRIKRGITREWPGRRELQSRTVKMQYNIVEVERDGNPEKYHLESSDRGNTIYIGERAVMLDAGVHDYKIKYTVPNQIGFYDDYDEIYWNALGDKSVFPIDEAIITLDLPDNADVIQESAYLGTYGQTNKEYTLKQVGDKYEYRSTRTLNPNEGFTIAVGFEKGHVDAPGLFTRFGSMMVIVLGLLFLLPYYFNTWYKHGQDPESPAVFPQWTSPNDLSPASSSFIVNEGYKMYAYTASIIALAIKGFLKINEVESGGFLSKQKDYHLTKLKNATSELPAEEAQVFNNLFKVSDEIVVGGAYNPIIEDSYYGHKSSLDIQHKEFLNKGNNYHLLWAPMVASLVIAIFAIWLVARSPYVEVINIPVLLGYGVAAVIAFLLYSYLIKRPSEEKLKLKSMIKGFKMYLKLAEKDRLNLLNPPEMTPEHFEAILPYAFALGVEHDWTQKFKEILAQAQYNPQWNNQNDVHVFGQGFGRDFSKTVGGAATPPPPKGGSGSGGGSGGGGFSGGGGGGGGVGGW